MVEVGREDERLVRLFYAEREAALLLRERPPRDGLRLALRDTVLPGGSSAAEGVHQAVVVGEPEGEGGGVEAAGEAKAGGCDGGGAAEIELHGVVQLVGVYAVDLGDVEVAVGGEAVKDAVEDLGGYESQLRREHGVEEALEEGEDPHERSQ